MLFFAGIRLKIAFSKLRGIVKRRCSRDALASAADAHLMVECCTRALRAFRTEASRQKEKAVLNDADLFFKRMALRRGFCCLQQRQRWGRAVSLSARHATKRLMLRWERRTLLLRVFDAASGFAISHWSTRAIRSGVRRWRHLVNRAHKASLNEKLAGTFRRSALLLRSFGVWRQLQVAAKLEWIARATVSATLLRRVLALWQAFVWERLSVWRLRNDNGEDAEYEREAVKWRRELARNIFEALRRYTVHRRKVRRSYGFIILKC
jgi:hypothetical protein